MGNSAKSLSRVVELEGGINFRDLGGYHSKNGQTVVWRKLLRCGHLSNLTKSDLKILHDIGLTHIHDFRREPEQNTFPNHIPNITQFNDYQMSLGSMNMFSDYASKGQLTAEISKDIMSKLYRSALVGTREGLGLFLKNIVQHTSPALVFHCMAGKDRTGLAAAALLMALDIDQDDIVEDYLLTQFCGNTPLITQYVLDGLAQNGITDVDSAAILPYCSVEKVYIDTFLDELKNVYGNEEAYLIDGLGLTACDINTLKTRYLE